MLSARDMNVHNMLAARSILHASCACGQTVAFFQPGLQLNNTEVFTIVTVSQRSLGLEGAGSQRGKGDLHSADRTESASS